MEQKVKSMEMTELQPELNYEKVGQRIKTARMEKNLNQADLVVSWLLQQSYKPCRNWANESFSSFIVKDCHHL